MHGPHPRKALIAPDTMYFVKLIGLIVNYIKNNGHFQLMSLGKTSWIPSQKLICMPLPPGPHPIGASEQAAPAHFSLIYYWKMFGSALPLDYWPLLRHLSILLYKAHYTKLSLFTPFNFKLIARNPVIYAVHVAFNVNSVEIISYNIHSR